MSTVPDAAGPTTGESPLRLALTPAVTGLLAGLALAGVWNVTAPRIEHHRQARLEASVREVLPEAATTLGVLRDDSGSFVPATGDVRPEVWVGWDSEGRLVGWAIPAEGTGYQDVVRILYGFDPAGRQTLGMEVLESRETPGLGDRIYKDADFVAGFRGLATDPLPVLVQEEPGAPNEVEAITGATISSRAVVRMIAESLAEWSPVLEGAEAPSAETGRPASTAEGPEPANPPVVPSGERSGPGVGGGGR